jgi:hypothetical protein
MANNKRNFRKERTDKKETIEGPSVTYNAEERPKGANFRQGKGKSNASGRGNDSQPHYRGTNDIRWYVSDDRLLQDVARLSFANPAGADIPLALGDGIYANTSTDYTERLPGVMTIECIPTFGISRDGSSPLNMGAQLLYNLIRAENSGARNYDAPDLMHYIMGVDSLFIYYANMLRLYGTLNNFTFLNRYTPKALVRAMGYDYDDLSRNMAQFRSYINTFAKRLSTFIMPHNITMIERHFNMFGRVYKDSESEKAQYYMYIPKFIWKYNAIGSTSGALLEPVIMVPSGALSTTAPGYTFSQIVTTGDALLAAMNDEDTLTMAGDMLKAFGEANIWKQDYINYDFKLDPVFDFTWLTQVQNLNSCDLFGSWEGDLGTVATGVPYTIQQVIPSSGINPWIKAECSWTGQTPVLGHAKLLVSPYQDPTPGDVMESTRLSLAVGCKYETNHWRMTVNSCGAEIVASVHIFTWENLASGLALRRLNMFLNDTVETSATDVIWTMTRNFAFLDAFAMHPTKYLTTYTGTSVPQALTDFTIQVPIADIDNWTVLHNSTIDGLHKVALLSMLYVRNVGFLSKY